MNQPTEGRILLVGEGNFSLSASLVEGGTISGPQLIASCIETFTAVQENHQLASTNINFLEKSGSTVLFEVDATDLHNHPDIHFYKFDRIIFNFPLSDRHNIKKNRALLSDFFSSVKNILDPENGQVMVTLCKGQGGTPADQPMRSWHDSWQVVSMAANAGLILTRIYPFQPDDFVRYKSVGFRFQDKGFNTENALTHVFEMAVSVTVPMISSSPCFIPQDNQQYVVPPFIWRKHDRWSLLDKRAHPVSTLHTHLSSHLSHAFPTLTPLPPNPPSLPKILPGYLSSLRSQLVEDNETNGDDCEMAGDGERLSGDCDKGKGETVTTSVTGEGGSEQTDAAIAPLSGGGDCNDTLRFSGKELKELKNRQTVAGEHGAAGDCSQETGMDLGTETGNATLVSDGQGDASSKPFCHGVQREGAERDSVQKSGSDRPCMFFPPLDSPALVVHTFSRPQPSQASHDSVSQAPNSADMQMDAKQEEAKSEGDVETGDSTMETAFSDTASKIKSQTSESNTKPTENGDHEESTPPADTLFHLRCSLLENVPHLERDMKAKARKSVLTSGIVYRKCPITSSQLPVSHEALLLSETESVEELETQLCCALKAVMDKDSSATVTTTSTTKCVTVGDVGNIRVNKALTFTMNEERVYTLGHLFEFEEKELASTGVGESQVDKFQGENQVSKPLIGAVLYLDTILLHILHLPDVRLLWSEDKRFLEQFPNKSSPQTSFPTFRPLSLYPVRFVHDISFWESDQRVFEEGELLDVVRDLADDTVTSVSLVDKFTNADTGKTSRCYRLVFQSHDRALSYITSWKMQSLLRLKVAQTLGVALR